MSNKAAIKEQQRLERLGQEEERKEIAELLIEGGNHPGVKKIRDLLQTHIDLYNGILQRQFQWAHDANGLQKKERLTIREIDQMVNSRDAYEEVLMIFTVAKQNLESADKAIDKLNKKK